MLHPAFQRTQQSAVHAEHRHVEVVVIVSHDHTTQTIDSHTDRIISCTGATDCTHKYPGIAVHLVTEHMPPLLSVAAVLSTVSINMIYQKNIAARQQKFVFNRNFHWIKLDVIV